MLAVTASGSDGSYQLEVSYDAGQTIFDLPDLYIQTDADGDLQWSTSENSGFTDLGVNVADGSVSSVDITVTYGSVANDEFISLWESLFDESLATVYLKDIWAPGVDLSFATLDIRVQSGTVVSTRDLAGAGPDHAADASQGDSGSLYLDAPKIDISGSLYTHVLEGDTTNAAGDISITAIGNLDDISSGLITVSGGGPIPLPDISMTRAQVDLDSATMKGRDVTIDVESDASDLFDDEDTLGGMGEPLWEWIGSVSVGAGVAISQATAGLNISGGTIDARNVMLTSKADTDAEAQVLSVYAAVAYGQSEPTVTVDIKNGAQITTSENLDIRTDASSDMSIITTQNLIGTSTTVEKHNVTVAGAYSDVVSRANLSSDSSLNVGNALSIDVNAIREHYTQSNAAAYGDGTLGVALNVAVQEATLESLIDGTVVTGGDMIVDAELTTVKNDYNATSPVGTGQLGSQLQAGKAGGMLRGFTSMFNSVFTGTGSAVGGNANFARDLAAIKMPNAGSLFSPETFGLAAAINAGLSLNDVNVRIGPDANISVGGDLNLRGHVEEFPETSAISFLNSSNQYLPEAPDGAYSQRETGAAGALTGGYFENHVDVYIGAGATVNVTGDMTIQSESSIPYDPQYVWDARNDGLEPGRIASFTDKFNYNLGIQNGLFSSWAEAIASAEEKAVGVMFNGLFGDSHNYAYIGDGASVTVGGDLQVMADTANDTINFVGSPLIPFNATAGQGIGLAFMVTGYINDTTARINPLATIDAGSLLVRLANSSGDAVDAELTGDQSFLISLSAGAVGRGHTLRPNSYTDVKKPNQLRVLDSNEDGKVTADDEHVTGINSIAATAGSPSFQTDANLLVISEDQSHLLSGTGAVTKTLSAASGGSVNVGVIHRETQAFIGAEERVIGNTPFAPGLGIDSSGLIVWDYDHGLSVGDEVVYTAGGDFPVGGLVDRGTYVVTAVPTSNSLRIGRAQAESNTTFGVSDINDNSGAWSIDLGYNHGFQNGDALTFSKGAADADIGGLVDGTLYYVTEVSGQRVSLAASISEVANQYRYQFNPATSITDDIIYFGFDHGLADGQKVLYRSGGGTPIGGLTDGETYFVSLVDDDPFAIQLLDEDNGALKQLDPATVDGIAHTLHPAFFQSDIVNSDDVLFQNTIDLGYSHDLQTGDAVRFQGSQIDGSQFPGFTDGARYYAIVLNDTTIALADSEERADAGRQQFF